MARTRTPRTPPPALPPAVRAALSDEAALRALDTSKTPVAIRAEAVAALAFLLGRQRRGPTLDEAAERIAAAQALRGLPKIGQARLAHAEGYILYQQGKERLPVVVLNHAVDLFPRDHRFRPRVFDTLGQYFQHTAGDLDRARAYYEHAYIGKQELVATWGMVEMWEDLALSSGNLGRLELTLERWAEAEKWTRIDLELEEQYGAAARPPDDETVTPAQRTESVRVRAMMLGQLARIALGRGPSELSQASGYLAQAMSLVPSGSYTEVTLWFDWARVALGLGDRIEAERRIARAEALATAGKYDHLHSYVSLIRGQVMGDGLTSATDPRFVAACASLDDAMAKFAGATQPQEQCETISVKAELLRKVGRVEEARRLVLDRGIPLAERSLFGQLQPLARLENLLAELDPGELAQVRARRMRGGIPAEEHTGRLRGERRSITVWTCDIRGFAAYCDEHDDAEVVATLNRFFRALGEPILAADGFIDKYVGDNILAYFTSASTAAGIALRALQIVDQLNTEWQHLHKEPLEIGIGIASGEAIVGSVGFAGKLEHTIIGSTVNLACRLVGLAGPGEIAIDQATARALRGEFRTAPWGRGKVKLKGFDPQPVFKLLGRPSAGGRKSR
jgi:class 3 adenylate cyclase